MGQTLSNLHKYHCRQHPVWSEYLREQGLDPEHHSSVPVPARSAWLLPRPQSDPDKTLWVDVVGPRTAVSLLEVAE